MIPLVQSTPFSPPFLPHLLVSCRFPYLQKQSDYLCGHHQQLRLTACLLDVYRSTRHINRSSIDCLLLSLCYLFFLDPPHKHSYSCAPCGVNDTLPLPMVCSDVGSACAERKEDRHMHHNIQLQLLPYSFVQSISLFPAFDAHFRLVLFPWSSNQPVLSTGQGRLSNGYKEEALVLLLSSHNQQAQTAEIYIRNLPHQQQEHKSILSTALTHSIEQKIISHQKTQRTIFSIYPLQLSILGVRRSYSSTTSTCIHTGSRRQGIYHTIKQLSRCLMKQAIPAIPRASFVWS